MTNVYSSILHSVSSILHTQYSSILNTQVSVQRFLITSLISEYSFHKTQSLQTIAADNLPYSTIFLAYLPLFGDEPAKTHLPASSCHPRDVVAANHSLHHRRNTLHYSLTTNPRRSSRDARISIRWCRLLIRNFACLLY